MTDSMTPDPRREPKVSTEVDTGEEVHHLDEGHLIDFLTNEPVKDNGKERVRQRILRVLFHEYQVAPEDTIRELDAATRRVDNAALVATLPDLDIPADRIVEQLEPERR